MPRAQLLQLVAPVVAANEPAAQLEHAEAPAAAYMPEAHDVQAVALAPAAYWPAAQLVQRLAAAAEYAPAVHATHAAASTEPVLPLAVPELHWVQAEAPVEVA